MISIEPTKYGVIYDHPKEIKEHDYYEMIYEIVDFVKVKGLTIKQAQQLFIDCSDILLHMKLN